jgi:Transglutaminase-like superfamily
MARLIFEAYLILLHIEFVMATRGLPVLHRWVSEHCVAIKQGGTQLNPEGPCLAMDWACVLYPKQVFCLQRSAATTMLLRRYGIEAEMLVGAQLLPFRSHAWVEVDGTVVNDKPYMREIYQVLDRF